MMRKEFKFKFLVWSLIWILGAIGLASCSNDDDNDEGDGIYQGYIQSVDTNSGYLCIIVTKIPSKKTDNMPNKKDKLYVRLDEFSNIDFKENQKLDFYITSAEGGIYPADMTYHQPYWYCKIIILKIK